MTRQRQPEGASGDLHRVLDISRAMVAAGDLDDLLQLIVERSMELLGVERASVLLYDERNNELVSRVATGVDQIRIPADVGISGATIQSGQSINVPDAYADARFNPAVDRRTGLRTRSILSLPLRDFQGGLVGVLQMINKRSGAFDDHDVMLAETLAAQAGVAIQRAELIGHYLKNQDLHKLLEVGRSMVAAGDLDSLLGLIIDRSMELLNAERASVFLYDAESNELVTRVAAGVDGIRVPADVGISGATVQSGKTINVPDAYADARFNPAVDRQTGLRTRNILSVPLRGYEGGLVGVLQVVNKREGEFDEYDETLGETLAAQAGVAVQRADLIEHYKAKLEMERAMQIAREIQQDLLPAGAPPLEGFDVCGFTQPADQTGGDAYDFFSLPDGRLMLLVADATGHGIGPALVMAETRAMLRAVSLQGSDISRILENVNSLLAQDLDQARFVTCFFGLLDPGEKCLTYASAGHGPILFYDRSADTFEQVPATGLPLGIMDDTRYEEVVTRHLAPGDLAVITTDGLFEACDASGEMFGVDRIRELLHRGRDLPAGEMIESLRQAVVAFIGDERQADDLTAIVIRRL
jgi:phosphoserine phosphatase